MTLELLFGKHPKEREGPAIRCRQKAKLLKVGHFGNRLVLCNKMPRYSHIMEQWIHNKMITVHSTLSKKK